MKACKRRQSFSSDDILMLVVLILIFVLIVASIGGSAIRFLKAQNFTETCALTEVTAAPGDTLWSYAEQYAPEYVGIRTYIDKVQELNQIETLQPGMKVLLWVE